VRVNQNGYVLHECKDIIQAEIIQCWAEAKAKLGTEEMQPFANMALVKQIREEQNKALEYDFREDYIRDYISKQKEVSVIELWENALGESGKPRKVDSNAIVQILRGSPGGWESGGTKRVATADGRKKVAVWVRTNLDGYDYGDGCDETFDGDDQYEIIP